MSTRPIGHVLRKGLLAAAILLAAAWPASGEETRIALRFAVLGDAEPKPLPEFPHLAEAVQSLNTYASDHRLDFVVGIGDMAHKGTLLQYDAATPILQTLEVPFYPIMGNEEFNSTEARFLDYANRWNEGRAVLTSRRYVQDHGPVTLVYASPDFSRDFTDNGIDWILEQLDAAAPEPAFLIVHAAQAGIFPENADKGVKNPRFAEVAARRNLAAIISGDLHMDMDRVVHSREVDGVHYLHVPALERTKIPDETMHTAMYRLFTITSQGDVLVDTYRTDSLQPSGKHAYQFTLTTTAPE
jgi:hypothetical protein